MDMNKTYGEINMGKTIRVLALSLLLLFMGCVSSTPPAVVNNTPPPAVLQDNSDQRQKDDLWCRQFGTFGNSQEMFNETYRKCMERFGYKF